MAELGPNEATVVTSLNDESRLQRPRSGKFLYNLFDLSINIIVSSYTYLKDKKKKGGGEG